MALSLRIENLSHSFEQQKIINNLSLELIEGEQNTLLGESGCGKTTLLKIISGFISVQSGEVYIQQQLCSSSSTHQAPYDRAVGMVFESPLLFPHLKVKDNILFGIKNKESQFKQDRLDELLSLLNIKDLLLRYPHEISRGQQQRVSLARALAPQPQLLLLDEPFSNLDAKFRFQLIKEFRKIFKILGVTTLFVTHNHEEAFLFSDQLGVMHRGDLQQWGSCVDLYRYPRTAYVAQFIGEGTIVPVVIDEQLLQTEFGSLLHKKGCPPVKSLFIRPENIKIVKESNFSTQIEYIEYMGSHYRLVLRGVKNSFVCTHLRQIGNLAVGDQVFVNLIIDEPILF